MNCPLCSSADSGFVQWLTDYVTGHSFHLHRCKKCSLCYLKDPPPAEETSRYYAKLSESLIRKKPVNPFQWNYSIRSLFDLLPLMRRLPRKAYLVDIGAGDGEFSDRASRLGIKVRAVDFFPLEDWSHPDIPYKQVNLNGGDLQAADIGGYDLLPNALVLQHALGRVYDPVGLFRTFHQRGIPGWFFHPKGFLAALSSAFSTWIGNTVCLCLFERKS
jgi:hypothetical protein